MTTDDRNPTGRVPTSTTPGPEGAHPESEGNYSFRCSEVNPSCNWEAKGRDENEVRRQVEQHGREQHNMSVTEEIWDKVRGLIRRRSA
jgi:predicted small metal-binding protein